MCLVLLLLTDIQTTPNATRSWAITVRHKSPFDLPPTESLRLCGCALGLVYAAARVTVAAGGGAWQAARRPGVGAGWARRDGPPRSQPNPRPRFTSPPLAARYVAAHWLRRTDARLVFLQKFPPWAAAELVTSVGAAPAAVTVTIRDGGGCCGTCRSPEVRVFPSLCYHLYPPSSFFS